ncbi:hypothetical protein OKW30_007936 [Paraburkholderia sp. Clong3]
MVRRETISGNCSEAPTDGAFTQVNIVRLCFTETASNNYDVKVSNIQLRLRLEGDDNLGLRRNLLQLAPYRLSISHGPNPELQALYIPETRLRIGARRSSSGAPEPTAGQLSAEYVWLERRSRSGRGFAVLDAVARCRGTAARATCRHRPNVTRSIRDRGGSAPLVAPHESGVFSPRDSGSRFSHGRSATKPVSARETSEKHILQGDKPSRA